MASRIFRSMSVSRTVSRDGREGSGSSGLRSGMLTAGGYRPLTGKLSQPAAIVNACS